LFKLCGEYLRECAGLLTRVAVAIMVLSLSGCGGYLPNYDLLARGPSTEFSAATLRERAQNQEDVIVELSIMAGLKGKEPVDSTQWAKFGAAAIGRAQLECNAYLTEIMKVDESRRTANEALRGAAGLTAAIQGLSGAAGSAITITALAFGLAQGSVDNITTGLLYSIGPDAVRPLVQKLRAAYLDKVTADSWKDRPTAFNTIYGYLEICTPAALREKIKAAISTAQAEATNVDARGFPPQVTLTTQRIIVQQTVTTPKDQLPPGPTAPLMAPNAGPTELRAYVEYVRQLQVALCIKPVDGNLGSPPLSARPSITRTAMRQYLSGRDGGASRAAPNVQNDTIDEINGSKSLERFNEARASAFAGGVVLKTCAERSPYFSNAYEVGRWMNPPTGTSRETDWRDLLRKMRRELNIVPLANEVLTEAKLVEEARKAIVDLRKKWSMPPDMPGAESGFDYTLTLRITALPD